jgi:hypothetical protein
MMRNSIANFRNSAAHHGSLASASRIGNLSGHADPAWIAIGISFRERGQAVRRVLRHQIERRE